MLFTDKHDCCGCEACFNICPHHAIVMKEDEEGFNYPKIIPELCIECGLCEKVCPLKNKPFLERRVRSVYAVKYKDAMERKESQSGGAFYSLAEVVIENGGIVYGAACQSVFCVHHKKVESLKECEALRGSKYIQSEIEHVYREIRQHLETHIMVLFTGTPCQVAGLTHYLGSTVQTDTLYTMDLICHGVSSPLMWREYLKYIEKKYNSEIVAIEFRDRSQDWGIHKEKLFLKEQSKVSYTYAGLFYSHMILRPSCETCPYTNLARVSDITVGDFWGIEKVMPDFRDCLGVSIMLINTDKGQSLFHKAERQLIIRETQIESVMQKPLTKPSEIPIKKREDFWRDYKTRGFEYVIKKYSDENIIYRITKRIKQIVLLGKKQ